MSTTASQITCYLDCVSPYSYFALLHLEKHRSLLTSHGVDIEVIPVFLGGINVGSGNKPPWTLPAKASYGSYDFVRAKQYFCVPSISQPSFFPILSLLPQRALIYIKATQPQSQFIATFLSIFDTMWTHGLDVSKPDVLAQVLSKHNSEQQVHEILEKANSAEWKQKLNDNTAEAVKKGAFGCPFFIVKNKEGVEEPFFGSDRFHYMWEFLGLPWKDFELLAAAKPKI